MSQFILENGNEVILPKIVTEIEHGYTNRWAPEEWTNEDHHAQVDSVSSTELFCMHTSPFNFLENRKAKQSGFAKAKNKSMSFGKVAHLVVLEPSEFRRRVVLAPKFDMRTTIGKEDFKIWQGYQDENAIIFKSNEEGEASYRNLIGVVNSISNHKKVRDMFESGTIERTGLYKDPETDLWCRLRYDFLSHSGDMNDLKTSKSILPWAFNNSVKSYGYDIQLAHYMVGTEIINGKRPRSYNWITVENHHPFEVACYTAPEKVIEDAIFFRAKLMKQLKECIVQRDFPQRQQFIEDLNFTRTHHDDVKDYMGIEDGE